MIATSFNRSLKPPGVQAAVALGQVGVQQEFSKSLLKLTYILQQCTFFIYNL